MSEVNVIAILGKVLENDKIYEGFVKLADIPEGAYVEEVLLENRKKMMATIIDSYTKQCIKKNKLVVDVLLKEKEIGEYEYDTSITEEDVEEPYIIKTNSK